MKKIVLFILFSVTTTFIGYGQNVKSDPAYSTSNYKHLNKAVKAEKSADRESKGIEGAGEVDQNYKAQNNKREVSPVVIIPSYYLNNSNVTKNYKQQFKPTGIGTTEIINSEETEFNTARKE